MMKSTLLLTESDKGYSDFCKNYISKHDIAVQNCSSNGHVAYEKIGETIFTYALFDLFMYGTSFVKAFHVGTVHVGNITEWHVFRFATPAQCYAVPHFVRFTIGTGEFDAALHP